MSADVPGDVGRPKVPPEDPPVPSMAGVSGDADVWTWAFYAQPWDLRALSSTGQLLFFVLGVTMTPKDAEGILREWMSRPEVHAVEARRKR